MVLGGGAFSYDRGTPVPAYGLRPLPNPFLGRIGLGQNRDFANFFTLELQQAFIQEALHN